ncbi:MAG: hypothetical protein ABJO27_17895 [Pseudoruegeria sp.]
MPEGKPSESPDQTYSRYFAMVKAGRSFEQDKVFYSKARQAEVMEKVSARSNGDAESVTGLKNAYLRMTEHMSKCSELTLLEESIEGIKAHLIYDIKDLCENNYGTEGREVIEMINEDGWKIASNTTSWK